MKNQLKSLNPFLEERAVIYIRVSTDKQAKEGHGLEAQEEECMRNIVFRKWKYLKTYSDEAISGTKENSEREGMTELLEDAKNRLFDIVVIYKLDRLGRTATIVVNTVKYIIDELNLRLISCSEDIDTSKPAGRLALTLFAGIAEYEKDIIVERLAMGREHVLKTKGETGGLINYGYVREEGKIVGISAEKANIVQKIISEYEDGKSLEQLTRDLNNMEIPAPKGGPWYSSSVRNIISNREKYEGCLRSYKNMKGERWPVIYRDYFSDVSKYIADGNIIAHLSTRRCAVYMRIANPSNYRYMDLQEEATFNFVKNMGLYIKEKYYETCPSASMDKRIKLEDLYKDAKSNKFSVVVIYRLNILAHNEELLQEIYHNLKQYNVYIISILGI